MRMIGELRLDGFLSFAPDTPPFELGSLNVLIGPNGSGKSNFVEAFEVLKAAPIDVAQAFRDGGGPSEWLWKGEAPLRPATIEAQVVDSTPTKRPLRYRVEFTAVRSRLEVLDEAIEEWKPAVGKQDPYFYYRFQRGLPVINVRNEAGHGQARGLKREDFAPDQSVLAQRRDPDLYPELTWLGQSFGRIQTFREWTFGRYAALRQPVNASSSDAGLLPGARNLALVLNRVEHAQGRAFDLQMKRFFPRFEHMSTRVSGGDVELFLHETGFPAPIPATRLSDGMLRFIALLATLLEPEPSPLVCIEEPELGLHPDAVGTLGELLLDASKRMQLVVTTHSDALVSALSEAPETVVACERLGAGTRLSRLDPNKLAHWLDRYRLGDLWRMGELGANP